MRRSAAVLVSALGLLHLAVLPAFAVSPETSADCQPIEIIVTAGTGESDPNDDPNQVRSFATGTNFARNLTQHFAQVGAWQTPYEASVGVIGTTGKVRTNTHVPYSVSKHHAIDQINERISHCSQSRLILVGYSQGADITGDVVKQVRADRLLAAYLVADPARAQLTGEGASTTTGTLGWATEDGGVLVPSSRPLPGPDTQGLIGSRGVAAFGAHPGKVRHICSGDDAVCSTDPAGLLADVGDWGVGMQASPQHGSNLARLRTMLYDGSLLRSLGPYTPALSVALTDFDALQIRSTFAQAAATPGLREDQVATLELTGIEVSGALGAVRDGGWIEPTVQYTGDPAIDRVFNLLIAAQAERGLSEIGYAITMPIAHFSYTGERREAPVVIEGARTDDWLEADMFNEIATELSDPRRMQPLPYSEHNTIEQQLGYVHWKAARIVDDGRSERPRELWERYGL